jgi:hypothetical protein
MKQIVVTLMMVLVWATLATAQDHEFPAPSADERLAFLRSLEGTWKAESGGEGMPGGRFEYRVSAGGNAVEERVMVGTPMEMLTVYNMDGEDLVATHYCMLGNQPRLTASPRLVHDTLEFTCNGNVGNSRSHRDQHVHDWTLALDAKGRLVYEVNIVEDGKPVEKPSFVLTRESGAPLTTIGR